ncbi:zinc ABC transporter substrate-binding protein [Chloroflexales bacterium ZM16-3]|nr:zinc ABC transporter substrate-binding protein [Chloroflexales bacterium ZM16-3]
MRHRYLLPLLAIAALTLGACGQKTTQPAGDLPRIVASTSIVADVVRQVGGDKIALSTLVPVGADVHSFAPAPQDVVTVSEAQIVFVNGAGLEAFLEPLLKNAGGSAEIVELAKDIPLREMSAQDLATEDDHAAEDGQDHGGNDPHTWTDPNNVIYWTAAISESLGRIDPANAGFYAANAKAYNTKLSELDAWITQEFATIPPDQRLLVTDHAVFGYMADRYGLTQVGTIIPGGSTGAEASAQDLAVLQDQIRSLGVKAIFVGNVSNPSLAEQLAQDTGVKLVTVLTGSLTPPDGPGATYIDYMRSNVSAIASALR